LTKNLIKCLVCLLFISMFSGCATISGYKDTLNKFDYTLNSNKCDYEELEEKIKNNDNIILWSIQAGSLARNCKNYKKSIEFFDKAEKSYKEDVDKDTFLNNTIESTTSLLINNNSNDYEGNTYERIMVNTYKALDFVSLNDHENARVEFNRALDRQRRAKEYFKKEIKELKNKLKNENKNNKDKNNINKLKVSKNKQTQDVIYKNYSNLLNNFKAYPDFVNPFTTYIAGIYFLLNDDSTKARDLLKESMNMAPKNKQILSDYKLSNKYITSLKKSKNNYAWIIYEGGKGLINDEIKIQIPLFLFTKKIFYTGIALPNLKERDSSFKYLKVNNKKTSTICNMDNVIKTEFKKRFPMIVTQTVFSAVTKTILQLQLNKQTGLIGGVTGAIYQALTNKADVRSWTALPKKFQSVRVQLSENPLKIKDDHGNLLRNIIIPKGKNALIFVNSRTIKNIKVHQILF